MRELATLADESAVTTLADHLLTLGIQTSLDRDTSGWVLWVRDEDRLPQAQQELEQYLREPNHPRYTQAGAGAEAVRKREAAAERRFQKNYMDARNLWARPAPVAMFVTIGLILASVGVAVLTGFGDRGSPLLHRLTFVEIVQDAEGKWRWTGLAAIERGEVWRLLTPVLIHFGFIHLLFNLFWLYDLGGRIEAFRGRHWFALLVLVSGVLSNFAQYAADLFMGDFGIFGGMSGVVYALFGYVWMKSRFEPGPGMFMDVRTIGIMLIWLVLCMTGVVGSIANTAHVAGLIIGLIAGAAIPLMKRLLK